MLQLLLYILYQYTVTLFTCINIIYYIAPRTCAELGFVDRCCEDPMSLGFCEIESSSCSCKKILLHRKQLLSRNWMFPYVTVHNALATNSSYLTLCNVSACSYKLRSGWTGCRLLHWELQGHLWYKWFRDVFL